MVLRRIRRRTVRNGPLQQSNSKNFKTIVKVFSKNLIFFKQAQNACRCAIFLNIINANIAAYVIAKIRDYIRLLAFSQFLNSNRTWIILLKSILTADSHILFLFLINFKNVILILIRQYHKGKFAN